MDETVGTDDSEADLTETIVRFCTGSKLRSTVRTSPPDVYDQMHRELVVQILHFRLIFLQPIPNGGNGGDRPAHCGWDEPDRLR